MVAATEDAEENSKTSRAKSIFMAKVAEQAERYEDMAGYMEDVAKTSDVEELTIEERNLLSVASYGENIKYKSLFLSLLLMMFCKEKPLSHWAVLQHCTLAIPASLQSSGYLTFKLSDKSIICQSCLRGMPANSVTARDLKE
ncbi:hypothetical protein R1sor_026655 [Riccia sorocarpa]|uniref:14-3-3 domain-containing protein n=1 Tax=Riccia sorocarpa TaxID=122646 RepID=A0ABD3GDP9_9MARC